MILRHSAMHIYDTPLQWEMLRGAKPRRTLRQPPPGKRRKARLPSPPHACTLATAANGTGLAWAGRQGVVMVKQQQRLINPTQSMWAEDY